MAGDWYYDTKTGEAVQGKGSRWSNRMGPYETRAEALDAFEIARMRTERADRWDEGEDTD